MQEENWKAFRKNNTEAGRLLARIYGVEGAERPKISYPRPKQQKRTLEHPQAWRNVGSAKRDPKEQKYNRAGASAVSVPKFRQKQIKQKAAVDCIPRRKQASIICTGISESEKQEAYRPPTKPALYTAEEKEKLSEINAFRGGKGLPKDLTHPEGELPSSIRRREEEEKKKLLKKGGKDTNRASTSRKTPNDLLFDQVAKEINERHRFQLELELAGVDSKSRQSLEKIRIEILSRIKELYRLDQGKARRFLEGPNRMLSTL